MLSSLSGSNKTIKSDLKISQAKWARHIIILTQNYSQLSSLSCPIGPKQNERKLHIQQAQTFHMRSNPGIGWCLPPVFHLH